MNTRYILKPEAIAFADAGSKSAILATMADLFARVYGIDSALLEAQLNAREQMGSTGFGRGLAIPHARVAGIKRPVAAFLKLSRPVDFDAVDGIPVEMVFGLISSEQAGSAHLHALAAISRLMRDESLRESLGASADATQIYGILSDVIDRDAA